MGIDGNTPTLIIGPNKVVMTYCDHDRGPFEVSTNYLDLEFPLENYVGTVNQGCWKEDEEAYVFLFPNPDGGDSYYIRPSQILEAYLKEQNDKAKK